jgi:hypothetical protein
MAHVASGGQTLNLWLLYMPRNVRVPAAKYADNYVLLLLLLLLCYCTL